MGSKSGKSTSTKAVSVFLRSKLFLWIAGIIVAIMVVLIAVNTVVTLVTAPIRAAATAVSWLLDRDPDNPPGEDDLFDEEMVALISTCLGGDPEAATATPSTAPGSDRPEPGDSGGFDAQQYQSLVDTIPHDADPYIAHGYLLYLLTDPDDPITTPPDDATTDDPAGQTADQGTGTGNAAVGEDGTTDPSSSTAEADPYAGYNRFAEQWILAQATGQYDTGKDPDPQEWVAIPPELAAMDPDLDADAATEQAPAALAATLAMGERHRITLTDEQNLVLASSLLEQCEKKN